MDSQSCKTRVQTQVCQQALGQYQPVVPVCVPAAMALLVVQPQFRTGSKCPPDVAGDLGGDLCRVIEDRRGHLDISPPGRGELGRAQPRASISSFRTSPGVKLSSVLPIPGSSLIAGSPRTGPGGQSYCLPRRGIRAGSGTAVATHRFCCLLARVTPRPSIASSESAVGASGSHRLGSLC